MSQILGVENTFKYNGKELESEFGLHWYDYGARFYDPQLGRWHVLDPKAELLESSSGYVYSLNSPINFIDKNGELPIFINGYTESDFERGRSNYWGTQLLTTVAGAGIPNPGGEFHWVDGNRYLYKLGSFSKIENSANLEGFTAESRTEAGYKFGKQDFQNILGKLAKDPKTGKITEKIQIYTHSRGAAFGVGYVEGLLEMINSSPELFADPSNVIEYVLNLAPHQSWALSAPNGIKYYSINHLFDILSGNQMKNTTAVTSNAGGKEPHSNSTFSKEVGVFIQSFIESKGNDTKLLDAFTNKMKEYGINVTYK